MSGWPLFDPTGSSNGGNNPPVTTSASATASAVASTAEAAAVAFLASPSNSRLLDNELIQLSQLMQSLAMHCHNLAYVKMCGGLQSKEAGPELSIDTTSEEVNKAEEGDGSSEPGKVGERISTGKSRQMPRMGLGATSTSVKASSTNGIAKSSG